MAEQVAPVEIEVCGPHGSQLYFAPIGRPLRGFVDFTTARSKSALALRDTWPEPVPGKIIGIDANGRKYVREPLHDKDHAKVRQRILNSGHVLPDEREDFESDTAVTWLYWMRRAVDAGLARVVKGDLPPVDQIETERKATWDNSKPRKDFIFAPPAQTASDKLAEAVEQLASNIADNTAVLKKLLEKLK